ncbi:MAG TPA: hypothetical protein VGZ23_09175 [bacterium]|nr:hypothetical protein [bacterium]
MTLKCRGVIPLTPEVVAALKDLRDAFTRKFGRPPGPDDPLFFNPDADAPRPVPLDRAHRETKKLLVASGAPPEIIYAFEKTGRIVTEQNKQFLTKAEIREWKGAIRQFRRISSGA